MTFTPAPACRCRCVHVFGHTECELGPPWVIEAERRLANMLAEQEARRRWWQIADSRKNRDIYGSPLD